MKTLRLLILFVLLGFNIQAQTASNIANSRSDTVNILHYQINLDITDFTNKRIKGNCIITFTPKMNGIDTINLDLLKLNIDSIASHGKLLTYTYNDTLVKVILPLPLNTTDTSSLTVYYNGHPQCDSLGFGGFYFDNTYAYNVGVGFNANPHTFGRVWFPCFDNFAERSTYEFNIITSAGRRATCNGQLISEKVIASDTIVRQWKMNEEIPSYLACVAVSDYETVHLTHTGINAVIPIELAARAVDTTNMKKSFVHLGDAIATFENNYGPYKWNKVGYSLTSFTAGAMEHSTNITFPQVGADGSLAYENYMSHELSHQWWGDLVTCETEGDMWINEGMAKYSEHLFLEKEYDHNTSLATIKYNHQYVLQYAHVNEGGYRAISGIPHQYTYGTHVYLKGASVIHNMRAYMGDSLFFVGLKSIIKNYQFKNINAYQYRDELKKATGIDMTNFFNNWVFAPGFSHFSIDSTEVASNGANFNVTLYVQQKLKGASNYHTGTPLEVTFYDANWKRHKQTITVSGQHTKTTVTVPFKPVLTLLNEDNKLNQARTDDQLIIKNPLVYNLDLSLFKLWVSSITDSALLQIEHHWVAPDPIKNNPRNYKISPNRYWTVEGFLPTNFAASAILNFDSRAINGYLDKDLIPFNAFNLILLYRKDAKSDWVEYPYYKKSIISPNPPFGTVTLSQLQLGEYAFATGVSHVGIADEEEIIKNNFRVYPNPSESFFWIESLNSDDAYTVVVYDLSGKLIVEEKFNVKSKIETKNWIAGTYIVTVLNKENVVYKEKVIVQ